MSIVSTVAGDLIAFGARIAGRWITLSVTVEGEATLVGEEMRPLAGSASFGDRRPAESDFLYRRARIGDKGKSVRTV